MKEEDYNEITAFHYAAFRPELHNIILPKCFEGQTKYKNGLDVGCGTGQSAIALTHYCEKVIGIEPSADMLKKALPHPAVKYLRSNGVGLPLEAAQFDVITFAGSWYYAKSQHLLNEVVRVAMADAMIVIYDFEVSQRKVLMQLGIEPHLLVALDYDHKVDFSGLDQSAIEFKAKVHEKLSIHLKAEELSHLLLAQRDQYELLAALFGADSLYENTKDSLQTIWGTQDIDVPVNLYYTIYHYRES